MMYMVIIIDYIKIMMIMIMNEYKIYNLIYYVIMIYVDAYVGYFILYIII